MDRVDDLRAGSSSSPATAGPTWVPATEDRGEGIFLQLDEAAVAAWEATDPAHRRCGQAHRDAHRRNFHRRFSETAEPVDPDTRLPAAALLAGAHLRARADPRDGDVAAATARPA